MPAPTTATRCGVRTAALWAWELWTLDVWAMLQHDPGTGSARGLGGVGLVHLRGPGLLLGGLRPRRCGAGREPGDHGRCDTQPQPGVAYAPAPQPPLGPDVSAGSEGTQAVQGRSSCEGSRRPRR